MSASQRISAAIGYIPVLGWIYVFFVQRKDPFATFHLRQSLGLVLSMLGIFLLWAVVAWIITWIPYGDVFAVAVFSLVLVAWVAGAIAWLVGVVNALRGLMNGVPLFGSWASRLPI